MTTVWITREIVFEDIRTDELFNDVRKDTIIPFLDELLATNLLVNWYTSLKPSNPGECPNYRIYVRVEIEDKPSIEGMFDEFIDEMEGLSYTEINPIKPTNFKDDEIESIQAGAESALHLLKMFPYYSSRFKDPWKIAFLKELLIPLLYCDTKRLHFIVVNTGGTDFGTLRWAIAMLSTYKSIACDWYIQRTRFGKLYIKVKYKLTSYFTGHKTRKEKIK